MRERGGIIAQVILICDPEHGIQGEQRSESQLMPASNFPAEYRRLHSLVVTDGMREILL